MPSLCLWRLSVCSAAVGGICGLAALNLEAQCDTPSPQGGLGANPNATLVYFIQMSNNTGSFTSDQAAGMENAIYGPNFDGTGWNGVNASGNGVTFTPYTGSGSVNITIRRGDLSDNHAGETSLSYDSNGYINGGTITVDNRVTDPTMMQKVIGHELGHVQGEGDANFQDGGTIMNQPNDFSDSAGFMASLPTPCDVSLADSASEYQCDSGVWYPNCSEDENWDEFGCCYFSDPPPDFLTVQFGSGEPTFSAPTVPFDSNGSGLRKRTAWPKPFASTGFLVLDSGHTGTVHDGRALFGRATPQPGPRCRWNEFAALAALDRPENGGNADGVIDSRDREFGSIMVWFDYNRDGVVDAATHELVPLSVVGISAIRLSYATLDRAPDKFGSVVKGVVYASGADGRTIPIYSVLLAREK
jgi:hypothetical protein